MAKPTAVFLRAHTHVLNKPLKRKRVEKVADAEPGGEVRAKKRLPNWPEHVLVLDCETTIDERQTLTFGAFAFCRREPDGQYLLIEEGFFSPDELAETDPGGLSILRQYVEQNPADTPEGYPEWPRVVNRSDFMNDILWASAWAADAMVVGFNLPFDLTRLALDNRIARNRNEGWSLVMFRDHDPKTGEERESPFRPRIIITPKDSKGGFIRFAGISQRSKTGQRLMPYRPGRFLDLRTLGWAIRNESYSLESACRAFGVKGKLKHEPTGRITREEIEYCRQDVRATVALLNAMCREFDLL
jgi:hypothetical protein